LRCPYQAKVIKTLLMISKATVRIAFIFRNSRNMVQNYDKFTTIAINYIKWGVGGV
jgi:hypothetical protein